MKNVCLALLLAGASLITGFLMTDGSGPTPDAPRPRGASGRADDAVLARIHARLDEMAAALARLERTKRVEPIAPRADSDLTRLRDELVEVSSALAGLRREIADGAEAAPRAPAPRALASLHRMRGETDWLACDALVAEWRTDREAGRRSVLFHSPAELLERLGAPTRVRGQDEGEVRWIYGTGNDAPRDYRIDLSLHDGYVTAMNVHE